MKAIHGFGPKDVRIVTVSDPVAKDGQVLVRITASGICGSDKWLWRSLEPVTFIAGHEVAGEVVGLGAGVRHLRLGDRVAINNVGGCGTCPACRAGEFVRCPSWDGSTDVNGGFAELVAAPERNCLRLADDVDCETGCLLFDNFGTPFAALERGGVGAGDDVLITGLGPIGQAAVILALQRGAFVIAADPLPYRREFALRCGAHAVLPADEHLPEAVQALTSGLGARVVVECSGKSPAYPLALASLRIGGTMVNVGEGAQFDLHPSEHLIRRHISMVGSWYSTMRQGQVLMEMTRAGLIEPRMLVTHRAPLDEFPALFSAACELNQGVMKAVITG